MIYLGNKPVGFADRHFLSASGTFTGDGNSSHAFSIGFKPDIFLVESDANYSTAGWAGIGHVLVRRGEYLVCIRHNNTTATTVTNTHNWLNETSGDFGNASEATQYAFYGTYADGTLTLTNKTDGAGTRFTNGRAYRWTAIYLGGE